MRRMFAVLVLSAAAGCGAVGRGDPHPDALVGRITTAGRPVKSVVVTAYGPDGKPAGGMTNDDGVYTIPNPPKGKLTFQIMSPGAGKPPFPARYSTRSNDLSVDYSGGKQTFDMELS